MCYIQYIIMYGEQVLENIKEVKQQQAVYDEELEVLLAKRVSIHKSIDSAVFTTQEIASARDETQKLHLRLAETAISADNLSTKVRQLDTAQIRLADALTRVVSS